MPRTRFDPWAVDLTQYDIEVELWVRYGLRISDKNLPEGWPTPRYYPPLARSYKLKYFPVPRGHTDGKSEKEDAIELTRDWERLSEELKEVEDDRASYVDIMVTQAQTAGQRLADESRPIYKKIGRMTRKWETRSELLEKLGISFATGVPAAVSTFSLAEGLLPEFSGKDWVNIGIGGATLVLAWPVTDYFVERRERILLQQLQAYKRRIYVEHYRPILLELYREHPKAVESRAGMDELLREHTRFIRQHPKLQSILRRR